VPRFASRGEDGSILIPGESFLADGLAAAGLRVAQSPLIFQGGNLLIVPGPSGDRVLLIGEAEVYRNVALGLSEHQSIGALRAELGADRALVLPSVSFHIDFDLLPWIATGRRLMFVNDPLLAARHILACGLPAVARAGLLDERRSREARAHLDSGRPGAAAAIIGPAVFAVYQGGFPGALAEAFAPDTGDSAVGNFQRFVLALDLFASLVLPQPGQSPHLRAYLDSFRRTDASRKALHQSLQAAGWALIPVPSLSEADLSVNYLNGLRDGERYLMPAWGGIFTAMDRAAADIFQRAMGTEAAVVPIQCAETQRRSGALHCAAAVYPDYARTI
jgi:hypothetical protein